MKKLIFVNGPAGVGKTSTCRRLLEKMKNIAWLESDWCWMLNVEPSAFTPETEQMVVSNISHILRNYYGCSVVENVIFNWVLHRRHLFDRVMTNINDLDYNIIWITLICNKEEHLRRMIKDGRSESRINRSIHYRYLYEGLSNPIIDTTELSIDETAEQILKVIDLIEWKDVGMELLLYSVPVSNA